MMETGYIFLLGFTAQALFSARVLVQWFKSEKAGCVVNPLSYWILSLTASLLLFIYGWLRKDLPIMMGQVIGYYAYIWNLRKMGLKGFNSRHSAALLPLLLSLLPPFLIAGRLLGGGAASGTMLLHNEEIGSVLAAFGIAGQLIFSLRFLYQVLYSSARGESLLPAGFWILSLVGAGLILIYGTIRLDPVVICGQAFGFVSYSRQLILCRKKQPC